MPNSTIEKVSPVIAVVILSVMMLTGCKSGKKYSGEIERSHLYQDYSVLNLTLESGGQGLTETDTIPVAAFPVRHFESAGEDYTLMDLGFPYYDPGGVTTRRGRYEALHDPGHYDPVSIRVERAVTRIVVVNASYGIARNESTALVAIPLKLPIKRTRSWIFWTKLNPDLIYFPARPTAGTVTVEGQVIPILEPAQSFPRGQGKDGESGAAKGKTFGIRGPAIPDHLQEIWKPPFLVVRSKVQLPGPGVPVSQDTRLALNFEATRDLFEGLRHRNDPLVQDLAEPEAKLILAWLDAFEVMEDAKKFHQQKKTPSFVAIDEPGLTQKKRDEKALDLAAEAKEIDPEWEFPDQFRWEVGSSLLAGEPAEKPGGSRSFRKLSLALDMDFKRMDLPPNRFANHWTTYIGFGLKYQMSQSLAFGATWKPFLFFKPFDFESWVPGRYSIRGLYQTPIRIQLGNKGYRLEIEAAYDRLPQVIEYNGVDYRYDEVGWELALGLTPRRNYWLQRKDQPWRLQFGYHWGADGSFVSAAGDHYTNMGQKVIYHPEGIFIRLEMSFGLF